jgi:CubicO group peptidase (beta-lactamase class C family)
VSAVVAYTLLARNEWSLDEALSKYWVDPDVRGDKRHQRITSRMALMHQTGLPNWRQSSRLSFSFTPGDRWQYSGEGFEYMRRALERKTGRSLEDLAKALIFEPLGMKRTSFVWPAWAHSRFAGEHDAAGQPMAYATPYEPNAAANMISSIDDYARFAVHVLNGAGVPADLFKDMTSAQTRPANPLDGEYWGVGWGVLKERDPHDDIVWHGGGQPGIRTIVMLQPARRRGVVVFTNATGGSPLIYAVVNATLNKDGRLRTLERSLSRQNRIPRVLESRDSTNTTCGTCGTSGPFP